jgi:hypothetical protein
MEASPRQLETNRGLSAAGWQYRERFGKRWGPAVVGLVGLVSPAEGLEKGKLRAFCR